MTVPVLKGTGKSFPNKIMVSEKSDYNKINEPVEIEGTGLTLARDAEGIYLTDGDLVVRGDFTHMEKRLKQANLQSEMLVKAARLKNLNRTPILLDATAGMGEDSLLLAASGFYVRLYEYDPVICALLRDTVERSREIPGLSEAASRMEVFAENSIEAMKNLNYRPDVILLDPMFPESGKSALIKKKFQLLRRLEKPCENGDELLRAAIAAKPQKIIIKRPLKGPFLGGIKPSYSLAGKAIRYDCLVFPENM